MGTPKLASSSSVWRDDLARQPFLLLTGLWSKAQLLQSLFSASDRQTLCSQVCCRFLVRQDVNKRILSLRWCVWSGRFSRRHSACLCGPCNSAVGSRIHLDYFKMWIIEWCLYCEKKKRRNLELLFVFVKSNQVKQSCNIFYIFNTILYIFLKGWLLGPMIFDDLQWFCSHWKVDLTCKSQTIGFVTKPSLKQNIAIEI